MFKRLLGLNLTTNATFLVKIIWLVEDVNPDLGMSGGFCRGPTSKKQAVDPPPLFNSYFPLLTSFQQVVPNGSGCCISIFVGLGKDGNCISIWVGYIWVHLGTVGDKFIG